MSKLQELHLSVKQAEGDILPTLFVHVQSVSAEDGLFIQC